MANKILRIWFSKANTSHPLGHHLNVCRLRKHRRKFPKDQISLVSNYRDFSQASQEYLVEICRDLKIELIDFYLIEKEIRNSKFDDGEKQLKLFDIIKQEINSDMGCLAAGSDIARILSPPIRERIYFDMDDAKLNPIDISKCDLGLAFAMKFGFNTESEKWFVISGNSTPFVCDESKNKFLLKYRALVLSYYTDFKSLDLIYKKMYEYQVFDEKNPTLNTQLINALKEKMKLKISKNKQEKRENLYPLLIRECFKELNLTEAQHRRAFKSLVLICSGPNCMQEALQEFIDKDFSEYCKTKRIELTEQCALIESMVISSKNHAHQNDTGWVPAEDDTQKNYNEYYAAPAAVCIQHAFRAYRKRKLEESNAPVIPKSQNTCVLQ